MFAKLMRKIAPVALLWAADIWQLKHLLKEKYKQIDNIKLGHSFRLKHKKEVYIPWQYVVTLS